MAGKLTEQSRPGANMQSPPKATDPGADTRLADQEQDDLSDDEDMLVVDSEDWDFDTTSALSALKMLISAVQSLAESAADAPLTPPVSRPATPSAKRLGSQDVDSESDDRTPMSPVSPVSPSPNSARSIAPVSMPSPEAHRDEPFPDIGADAQARSIQQAAIARRFFLKSVPPFSLADYLERIHHYCPHSPGVYLTAAAYIHRLCVVKMLVPATLKSIHRLCLAAIRVASKVLEDHKWRQERISKVGGVSLKELKSMEINMCFLLDFELFVNEPELKKRVFQLQQAAARDRSIKKRVSSDFNMRIPVRGKVAIDAH